MRGGNEYQDNPITASRNCPHYFQAILNALVAKDVRKPSYLCLNSRTCPETSPPRTGAKTIQPIRPDHLAT